MLLSNLKRIFTIPAITSFIFPKNIGYSETKPVVKIMQITKNTILLRDKELTSNILLIIFLLILNANLFK